MAKEKIQVILQIEKKKKKMLCNRAYERDGNSAIAFFQSFYCLAEWLLQRKAEQSVRRALGGPLHQMVEVPESNRREMVDR